MTRRRRTLKIMTVRLDTKTGKLKAKKEDSHIREDKLTETIEISTDYAKTKAEVKRMIEKEGFTILGELEQTSFWRMKLDEVKFRNWLEDEKQKLKERKRLERQTERDKLKAEILELKALRKEKKTLETS